MTPSYPPRAETREKGKRPLGGGTDTSSASSSPQWSPPCSTQIYRLRCQAEPCPLLRKRSDLAALAQSPFLSELSPVSLKASPEAELAGRRPHEAEDTGLWAEPGEVQLETRGLNPGPSG